MDEKFKPLDEEEVVYIPTNSKNLLGDLNLSSNNFSGLIATSSQFLEALRRKIGISDGTKNILFYESFGGEVLKFKAQGWQSGKIRVKLTVEFCPDEPEGEESPASNQPETSEPESPLDDIRRMMTGDNT